MSQTITQGALATEFQAQRLPVAQKPPGRGFGLRTVFPQFANAV